MPNMSVVEEWSDLSINCSATGFPLPIIYWERKGGIPLSADTRIKTSLSNNLVRHGCRPSMHSPFPSFLPHFPSSLFPLLLSPPPSSSTSLPPSSRLPFLLSLPSSQVTSTLTIPELDVRDSGMVRCVASNPHTSAFSNYISVSVTRELIFARSQSTSFQVCEGRREV